MSRTFIFGVGAVATLCLAIGIFMLQEPATEDPVPAWMVGTFSTATPYPQVFSISAAGEVLHLILDNVAPLSTGRGQVVRTSTAWVAHLDYGDGSILDIRFEPLGGAKIGVADKDSPLPVLPFAPGALCAIDTLSDQGQEGRRSLMELFLTHYVGCTFATALRAHVDQCCQRAIDWELGTCASPKSDDRLRECLGFEWYRRV